MKKVETFIKSDGVKLWCQLLYKKMIDIPCVLISGAGASAMFWSDHFCEILVNSGYRVIRFDHRDQGLSDAVDWDSSPYTVDDLAKDVINILDANKIRQAHVVGHSMGGTIAQLLAIHHPNRLLSYTSMSVATTANVGGPSKETMDALMENKPTQSYENDLPGFMRSWKILNAGYPVDPQLASAYTLDLYQRSKHKVGVAWHHIWCQENYGDLSEKLSNITVKGLFIHGEDDPLIPVNGGKQNQLLTPNSELIVIEKMGHMFFNMDLEKIIANHLVEHFNS